MPLVFFVFFVPTPFARHSAHVDDGQRTPDRDWRRRAACVVAPESHSPDGREAGGRAQGAAHRAARAGGEFQHAAAPDRAHRQDRGAPGGPRGNDHWSAGLGRVQRREAHTRRARLRQEARGGIQRDHPRADAEG